MLGLSYIVGCRYYDGAEQRAAAPFDTMTNTIQAAHSRDRSVEKEAMAWSLRVDCRLQVAGGGLYYCGLSCGKRQQPKDEISPPGLCDACPKCHPF